MKYLNSTIDTTQSLVIQKQELRKILKKERQKLYQPSQNSLWGDLQFQKAETWMHATVGPCYVTASYFPINEELNLAQFVTREWIFPKISGENLIWFKYGEPGSIFQKNKFGIPEKEDAGCFELWAIKDPVLCFVPGLGGAVGGSRIGYGGGYYDRLIHQTKKYKKNVKFVLCLPSENFFFDRLPIESWDEKVDFIFY